MRRVAVAFFFLASAVGLIACGDAGDHFLDFHQNPPGPTVVNRLAVSMPIVPTYKSGAGKFDLYVTAYSGGNAIPQGTVLNNPIVVSSNYDGYITFDGSGKSKVSFGKAPGTITVSYKPPPYAQRCYPGAFVIAFNKDANPQSEDQAAIACPSPSSSPTTSPTGSPTTSPSGSPQAVASMAVAFSATPDPTKPATLQLNVTLNAANGKPIYAGTPLTQPLVLSSNAACNITFAYGTGTNTSAQFYLAPGTVSVNYTPGNSTCVAPPTITIFATDASAKPKTVSTSFASASARHASVPGTRTVAKIELALASTPNPSNPALLTLGVKLREADGKTIPAGTNLSQPLAVNSNSSCNVTFTYGASTNSALNFSFAPGFVTVNYTPPSTTCGAPASIVIGAYDKTAKPKAASTSFAIQSTVAKIKLSMVATPNPASEGIYPLTISALDSSGNTIAPGTFLTNSVLISSNASCIVSFGTNGGNLASTWTLGSMLDLLVVSYVPSSGCTSPATVVVSANASGAAPATFKFGGPAPTPTPPSLKVARIVMSAASTPNPQSGGTFELVLSPIGSNGKVIPVGTTFSSPIQLTSNASCNITFQSGNGAATALTLTSMPSSVTVNYLQGCPPPSQVLITAFTRSASPQAASLSVLGGSSTVKSIALTMLSKPYPKSNGVYPFYVTAKDGNGKVIPFGQSLTYPIQLSSNASCVTTFGSSPTESFHVTDTITNTSAQVFLQFDPGAASSACPSPPTVVVTAIAQGSSYKTFSFTNGLPVP